MSLVLLPGLDGTGSLLRPLLDELGDMQARVIAYPTAQALNLGELSALVLRQLPAKKAVLVAESFSGLVALSLLTSAATRVSGIIFVGAFAEPPRPLLLRLSPLVSHSPNLLRSAPAFLLRQFCLGAEATTNDLNRCAKRLPPFRLLYWHSASPWLPADIRSARLSIFRVPTCARDMTAWCPSTR